MKSSNHMCIVSYENFIVTFSHFFYIFCFFFKLTCPYTINYTPSLSKTVSQTLSSKEMRGRPSTCILQLQLQSFVPLGDQIPIRMVLAVLRVPVCWQSRVCVWGGGGSISLVGFWTVLFLGKILCWHFFLPCLVLAYIMMSLFLWLPQLPINLLSYFSVLFFCM